MKKHMAILVMIAAIVLTFVLLIIVRNFKSPEETLTPPSRSGENAKIEAAFQDSIHNKDYTLVYPSEGDNRSAFVKADIDGDGTDEVLVFYTLESSESTVRINLLKQENKKWKSMLDEAGYGSQIDSVSFDDLNGDGKSELIMAWSLFDGDSSKVLTVHSPKIRNSKLTLKTLVNESYAFMSLADMDDDNTDEILVVTSDTTGTVPTATASVLKMNSAGTIKPYGNSAALDGNVSGYVSLKIQLTGSVPILYLDAMKGSDAMITEVLLWDAKSQSLLAPFTDSDTLINQATYRSEAIPCQDVDGDGRYEIPVMSGEKSSSSSSQNSVSGQDEEVRMPLVTWSKVYVRTDGYCKLEPYSYSFVNANEKYRLNVSKTLSSALSVYRMNSTGVVTVYASGNGVTKGTPLFSIVTRKQSDLNSNDTYSFRRSNGDTVVLGNITSAGKAQGFTDSLIEKSIVFY